MANVSVKEIQFWNNEIYKNLNDHAKEKLQQLGYSNKGNNIVLDYLRLLRITSDWTELQELVEKIKVTPKGEKYEKIKKEILDITNLDYEDDYFKSEILSNIHLDNLNYLDY